MARNGKLTSAMREVHRDEPSTVTRAKSFGPGGKEAMLRAVAFSKARKAGAKIPKKKGNPHPRGRGGMAVGMKGY